MLMLFFGSLISSITASSLAFILIEDIFNNKSYIKVKLENKTIISTYVIVWFFSILVLIVDKLYINLKNNIFSRYIGIILFICIFLFALYMFNYLFKKYYNEKKEKELEQKIEKEKEDFKKSKKVIRKLVNLIDLGIIKESDISNEILYTEEGRPKKVLHKIIQLHKNGYFKEFSEETMDSFFRSIGSGDILVEILQEDIKYKKSQRVLEEVLCLVDKGIIKKSDISNEFIFKKGRYVTKILAKVIELHKSGYFNKIDNEKINDFFIYMGNGQKLFEIVKDKKSDEYSV